MNYPALELLVAGQWLAEGSQRDTIAVTNPATNEVLGRLPVATAQDVDRAVDAARQAFPGWARTPALARSRVLLQVAASVRAGAEQLARVLTLEQGKPLPEALAEIGGVADTFEWMAEEGKRAYGRVVPSRMPDTECLVLREPVGPVAALTPWNAPAVLFARKVATALAAGCTVVAKPAEETPGVCVEIARLCAGAGLPAGVLNVVFGRPAEISARLIESPDIKLISFTGSVPIGRRLLEQASAQMKRAQLELGGHSPVIVDRGVDVARVAELASVSRFRNSGQNCHGPTRFIVHAQVYDTFCARMASLGGAIRVGNGLDADTRMGPLIHRRRVDAMRAFTDDARSQGARVLCGGAAPSQDITGNFWLPTVISDIPPHARAMREEVFGPIALVTPFDDLDKAIELANSVDFGLGAYAFSNSFDVLQHIQARIEAGNLSINTFAITPPEVPFCGIKQSGMGSEMGSEGLLEYFNTKTVLRASRPC